VIRIAITATAYRAICATLPLGSVAYEADANERCERLIWLDHAVVARLRAMRGPGESYSDVILRLAAGSAATTAPPNHVICLNSSSVNPSFLSAL
jgi:hypothetical protein